MTKLAAWTERHIRPAEDWQIGRTQYLAKKSSVVSSVTVSVS